MNQGTARRSLQGSVSECFEALLEIRQWPEWRPGLQRIDAVSDVPLQAGAAWVEAHAIAGATHRFAARAIEVDAPRTLAFTLASDRLEAVLRWQVRHHDEKTVVVQQATARNRGLGPMLAGLASRFVEQQDAALDALRARLDARLGHGPEQAQEALA